MHRRRFIHLAGFAGAGVVGSWMFNRSGNPSSQAVALDSSKNIPSPKGFVYSGKDPELSTKLSSLGVSWFYTWNPKRPEAVDTSLPFTPMIWGSKEAKDPVLGDTLSILDQPGIDNSLLGFNEPDNKSQSNLTVDQAIALWPFLMQTGRRLGSPATAGNPITGSWMPSFMQKVQENGYQVDFMTIHWYAPPHAQSLIDQIDRIYQTYNRPIWITEFAVADWQAKNGKTTRYTVEQVIDFMNTVIPALIQRPYVERFAWKTRSTSDPIMGTSAIFNDDGSLTEVGQLYASY